MDPLFLSYKSDEHVLAALLQFVQGLEYMVASANDPNTSCCLASSPRYLFAIFLRLQHILLSI